MIKLQGIPGTPLPHFLPPGPYLRIMCGSILDESYSWLCDWRMGGGALSLLGSNIIDLITYLGFGTAVRVHANLRTLKQTTDTIGTSSSFLGGCI